MSKSAEDVAAEQLTALAGDYYRVFIEDPGGQAVISDLMRRFGWQEQSMMYDGKLEMLPAREGGRNVIQHIGNMCATHVNRPVPRPEQGEH